MLNRTVRHTLVAAAIFVVAGVTASTAAGVARVHREPLLGTPAQPVSTTLPAVSGDLGEVVVHAPGELGEVIVRATRGPGDVRAAAGAPRVAGTLATVVVNAPRTSAPGFDRLVAAR